MHRPTIDWFLRRMDVWPLCGTCQKKIDRIIRNPDEDFYILSCHGKAVRWSPDWLAGDGHLLDNLPKIIFELPWRGFEVYRTTTKPGRRVV